MLEQRQQLQSWQQSREALRHQPPGSRPTAPTPACRSFSCDVCPVAELLAKPQTQTHGILVRQHDVAPHRIGRCGNTMVISQHNETCVKLLVRPTSSLNRLKTSIEPCPNGPAAAPVCVARLTLVARAQLSDGPTQPPPVAACPRHTDCKAARRFSAGVHWPLAWNSSVRLLGTVSVVARPLD